ncbi:MAG: phosphodiester glycosidase family protein [Ignavibacteriaceae bacterium]|jgi:exopolysaccharide biosynthesis protein
MLKKNHFLFVLILLTYTTLFGQSNFFPNNERKLSNDSLEYFQVSTDTLFSSKQVISFLILPKTSSNKVHFEISYNNPDLMTTSSFGEINNAVASLNGSYFDMDSIAGVCYLEVDDSVINRTRTPKLKWAKPESVVNGAVIISKDDNILVQQVKSEQFYKESKEEKAVLVSGPLLLINGKKTSLPDIKFVTDRHPRTLLCTTENDILFIAVDGRSSKAEGMNLFEAQDFLLDLRCIDAINLDGGGSTTLWIKGEGIINNPSDLLGERPVSNAILIMMK